MRQIKQPPQKNTYLMLATYGDNLSTQDTNLFTNFPKYLDFNFRVTIDFKNVLKLATFAAQDLDSAEMHRWKIGD